MVGKLKLRVMIVICLTIFKYITKNNLKMIDYLMCNKRNIFPEYSY